MSSQSSSKGEKSIFISYRREDSQDVTGRIYDRLIQTFHPKEIFKDVDNIPFGVDFREYLTKQVSGCRVLLAIVGSRWTDNIRLQDERDFVRIEIEYGLDPKRDILVVPVLVGNASMPANDQLPPSLRDFTFRNAINIRPDPDFHQDMNKLIKSLKDVIGVGLEEQKRVTETGVPSHMPYRYRGREFYTPKELAIYFRDNWAEGIKQFERGYIYKWVEEDLRDHGMASSLTDISEDVQLDKNLRLSLALVLMNDELPLLWEGEVVSREWVESNPGKVIDISQSRLPEWHNRLFNEDWLEKTAKIVREIIEDEKLVGTAMDIVLDMILNRSEWGEAKVFTMLESASPEEVVELLESSLPDWYARVTGDQMLQEARENHRTWRMRIKEIGVPVDWAKADELILQNKEVRVERFKALVQKFVIGKYVASSNVQLQALLNKDDLGSVEQIVMLCCDEDLFLSPQGKHRLDSMEYLKSFNVGMDWKLAEDLIDSAKHEKIYPLWQDVSNKPIHPHLKHNKRIKSIYESENGLYLDMVALIAASAGCEKEERAGTLLWEFQTGGMVRSSPAISTDGVVYVGSDDNKIYALYGKDGTKIWEFETGGPVLSSPAIGHDGTIYVGSTDKYVYALNGTTGARKWVFLTGKSWEGVQSSPAIGVDGTVYIGASDNRVYALDGETGAKKWEFESEDGTDFALSIATDGTLYVGSSDKNIYALDGRTGNLKWELATGEWLIKGVFLGVNSTPAVGSEGIIYVGSIDNKFFALDGNTGAKIWTFETGGAVLSSPAIGLDGTIYVGSGDSKVYAIDEKTGTEKWEFESDNCIYSSPAIGLDGTIYITSQDGKIYALDGRIGAKIWELEIGGGDSSPAIGTDGSIFVGSVDKNIYAIASGSQGLAQSSWPMRGQNRQHTSRGVNGKNRTL